MERKDIFVVLGMARSGTSLIARGLQALGVDLGSHLTPGNDKWNPKGFWEDKDIVYKINRGLIYYLDFTEMQYMKNIHETKVETIQTIKQSAIRLLYKRMDNKQNWGFKDPRTATVLPFWQDVFNELQLNEHYIIALRNPLASASSYHHVKGVDIEMGLLFWLVHLIAAIEQTFDKHRIIIDYDELIKNPMSELNKLKNFLPFTIDTEKEVNIFIEKFIDKNLQHYCYTHTDLQNHEATSVAPICAKLYELLKQSASDNIYFHSGDFLHQWKEIKKEFDCFYPIYNYINLLNIKNKKLEKTMRSIKKSLPWKILSPMSGIENFIKNKLKSSREKKRLARFYYE